MFSFSKWELASFYEQITVNVAERLQINDAIWKSRGELEIEIQNKDESISMLLTAFFEAYQAWYDFSYGENGQGRNIEGGESEQYTILMNDRDTTRNALLSKLSDIRR